MPPDLTMRPLTIAYITSAYARASDTFIRSEVRELRGLGHVVHTFSVRRPAAHEVVDDEVRREQAATTYLLEAGAPRLLRAAVKRALRSPRRACRAIAVAFRSGPAGIKARLWQLAYFVEAALLADHLERCGVEHVHDHIGENSATVAMLASVLTGIPFSTTVHGPTIFNAPHRWALGDKVARSAFTVCISSFTRSQCMAFTQPQFWDRLKLVRCGLSADLLQLPVTPVPDVPRFVCVGRLCPEKGQVLLVRAAARLAAKGLPLQFRLIGDGPTRGDVEREIERHDLRGKVEVLGWMDARRVREEVVAARAVVVPSFAEGLPVVLMEALALGRPAISTAIAGIPELVRDGISGWLVPAGDVESLAAAIEKVLRTSVNQLSQMGRVGRARVAEMHDGAAEASALAGLFLESAARLRPAVVVQHPEADGLADGVVASPNGWDGSRPAAAAAGDSSCVG